MSVAGACWKPIQEADPGYAARLYTPPFDQVFYRLGRPGTMSDMPLPVGAVPNMSVAPPIS